MVQLDRLPTVNPERPCPDLCIDQTAGPQAADVLDASYAVANCGLAVCFCKGPTKCFQDGAGLSEPGYVEFVAPLASYAEMGQNAKGSRR